jgi:hypothetical protein
MSLIRLPFYRNEEKHWCKASKGVKARNHPASDDKLVDIWWPDIFL